MINNKIYCYVIFTLVNIYLILDTSVCFKQYEQRQKYVILLKYEYMNIILGNAPRAALA